MKKKLVVVLALVIGATWWAKRAGKPDGRSTVQESCSSQASQWCSLELPRAPHGYIDQDEARSVMEPHQRCTSDYYLRCIAGRDPAQLVNDRESSLEAIAELQRSWRRGR